MRVYVYVCTGTIRMYVCVRACVGRHREKGRYAMCERGIDNNAMWTG